MLTDVFEVCVSHILDTEDEDVLVVLHSGTDGGVKTCGFSFGGFLLDGGGVDDAGAFGFWHRESFGVCLDVVGRGG